MIFDKIENMSKYFGARPELAQVAEALGKLSTLDAALGKHEIAGDSVFAFVAEYAPLPRQDKKLENHHTYIDIQIVVDGEEELDVCYTDAAADVPYSSENDIEFVNDAADISTFVMKPGYFLMLFPGEWHKPGILRGNCQKVRKIVAKIKN